MSDRRPVDFSAVEPKHAGVHDRLENWARWVGVRLSLGKSMPMWRWAKSPQHWEAYVPPVPVDSMDAQKIEKAVSGLPEKHREAVRWSYVHRGSPSIACRELAVSKESLAQLVRDGRQTLLNRIGEGNATVRGGRLTTEKAKPIQSAPARREYA